MPGELFFSLDVCLDSFIQGNICLVRVELEPAPHLGGPLLLGPPPLLLLLVVLVGAALGGGEPGGAGRVKSSQGEITFLGSPGQVDVGAGPPDSLCSLFLNPHGGSGSGV